MVWHYVILWSVIGAFFVVLTVVANGGLEAATEHWRQITTKHRPLKRSAEEKAFWLAALACFIIIFLWSI